LEEHQGGWKEDVGRTDDRGERTEVMTENRVESVACGVERKDVDFASVVV
jgi:hypothetical protein